MSKASLALSSLPPEVAGALLTLGERLALARLRRRESQKQWAARLGVSVPTLIRMERGDPSVRMGVYATALWLAGMSGDLADLADPAKDQQALEADVRKASRLRAARTRTSSSGPAPRSGRAQGDPG
jgi:transcriptional regulator with XRE-family HTH domain